MQNDFDFMGYYQDFNQMEENIMIKNTEIKVEQYLKNFAF